MCDVARVEQKSPAIFSGGGHEFKSEIGLFRQLAGTQLFAARVQSGSQIELGENVQLRSIVRSGDGWNYSKLTDVVIQRYDGMIIRVVNEPTGAFSDEPMSSYKESVKTLC